MNYTACIEPQCLYKGALNLYLFNFTAHFDWVPRDPFNALNLQDSIRHSKNAVKRSDIGYRIACYILKYVAFMVINYAVLCTEKVTTNAAKVL
jgi:hypothetical protein